MEKLLLKGFKVFEINFEFQNYFFASKNSSRIFSLFAHAISE